MSADISEIPDIHILRSRGEIIDKLKLMQTKKSLLSAQPDGRSLSYMTTVVQVMPEKGLVVMDLSENPGINQTVLAAQKVTFRGQVEGVPSRFVLTGLVEATLNGQTVFVAAIPDSLYWRQRRTFYRVAIPIAIPAKCVLDVDGKREEFAVADISLSGLAMIDKAHRLGDSFAVGHLLEDCRLVLPQHGELTLGLEIRNKAPMTGANPPTGQRVGCAFRGTGRNFEVILQKFIYEVELHKKRQDDLSRRDR